RGRPRPPRPRSPRVRDSGRRETRGGPGGGAPAAVVAPRGPGRGPRAPPSHLGPRRRRRWPHRRPGRRRRWLPGPTRRGPGWDGVVGEGAELVAVVAVAGLEGAALGVGEDGVAGVEVVGPPAAHADAGLEAEGLPCVPEGGEAGDRLVVVPPLGAPPAPPAV